VSFGVSLCVAVSLTVHWCEVWVMVKQKKVHA